MLVTSLRLILVASLSMTGGAIASATTLNFVFTAQITEALNLTDAPSLGCSDASGGTQYPLGCFSLDSKGGHAMASIGGPDLSSNTITSTYSFNGSANAAIFVQPGADTAKASAGYSFAAMISPLTSGDTFQFTLSDVNTCTNSLGACTNEKVLVYGASSIKGSLIKGEKITASGPVILDLAEDINVYNFVPSWSKSAHSILDITPVSETAPKHHQSLRDAAAFDNAVPFADPLATPEPGSMGLLGVALAGVALVSIRKAVSRRLLRANNGLGRGSTSTGE